MNAARRIVISLSVVLTIGAFAAQSTAAGAGDDRIQPYSENAFYWQYEGQPVLLLGGTDDDNLFQWTGGTLIEQLDLLESVGGNYVRNTMSGRDEGNLWPYQKIRDKYDLNRFNDEYWRRFETFLDETERRDIIVQIEVWATWDFYGEQWATNPFNPKNNVNYSSEQSGLPDRLVGELAKLKERHHRVIELRFFGGLTIRETAHVLGVSPDTVKDDWQAARTWLRRRLGEHENP